EGLALAGVGLTIGLIGAYFVGRGMQSTLYGVGKLDLSVFASVALLLLFAAAIACLVPARRAASVEPMQGLRAEGSYGPFCTRWELAAMCGLILDSSDVSALRMS